MCIYTRTLMREGGLFAPNTDSEPLMDAARITHALLVRAGTKAVRVNVHRSGLAACEGWAILRGDFATIRLWVGACDYAGLIATIAHEVAHVVFPPTDDGPAHGHDERFWRGLVGIMGDAYGIDVRPALANDTRHACDERIEAALLERYAWAARPVRGYVGSVREALAHQASLLAREQQGAIAWTDLRSILHKPPGTILHVPIWTSRGAFEWRLVVPRVAEVISHDDGERILDVLFRRGGDLGAVPSIGPLPTV